MRIALPIGCAPASESCAQTIHPDFDERAQLECRAFQEQLARIYLKTFGAPIPLGVRLETQSFPHDFRAYYEVVARVDDENESDMKAAYWIEAHTPEYWDAPARKLLGLP